MHRTYTQINTALPSPFVPYFLCGSTCMPTITIDNNK